MRRGEGRGGGKDVEEMREDSPKLGFSKINYFLFFFQKSEVENFSF